MVNERESESKRAGKEPRNCATPSKEVNVGRVTRKRVRGRRGELVPWIEAEQDVAWVTGDG